MGITLHCSEALSNVSFVIIVTGEEGPSLFLECVPVTTGRAMNRKRTFVCSRNCWEALCSYYSTCDDKCFDGQLCKYLLAVSL